jgi:hypothetical protein
MIFFFSGSADELAALYQPNKQELQTMSEKVDEILAQATAQKEAITKVSADTTRILAKIDTMTNGATPAELDAIKDALQGNLDALNALDAQVPEDETGNGGGASGGSDPVVTPDPEL